MKKVVGLMLGLVPVSAFGECVPVPDCASIGYTETSCDGGSIKCPFDTTKLKCIPCDSSFRFTCDGENIKEAVGEACNNKYAACSCIAGATFINGECVCDTSCVTIGNIYYSDGTCSSCNITDKTPVGIIAYKDNNKHLMISIDSININWATSQTDNAGNTTIFVNNDVPTLTNSSSKEIAKTDFNGVDNTMATVNFFGENAEGVAAVYCYNYAPVGWENTKKQWYLPAMGELYNIAYINRDKINTGLNNLSKNAITTGYLWSSSEYSSGNGWCINSSNGYIGCTATSKATPYAIVCAFAIN